MGQKQIINYFRKVDKKFLTELDNSQRQEAIDQFQRIWLNEKPKITISLNRRHKVMSNIVQKQIQQVNQCQEIAENLKSRMENHIKKREHLQIQKLKNYKNLDRAWKDKMMQIRTQTKGEQKVKLEKYKQISKQIEQFWRKKQSPSRSQSKSYSPRLQSRKSNYFSRNQDKITERNQEHRGFRFLTQARQSIEKQKKKKNSSNRSPRIKTQFPIIGDSNLNIEESVSLKQHKSKRTTIQSINYQAMKSNQQWKAKQNSYFQNAMEKMDKIMKIRLKVRENIKDEVKKAKNSRILKEDMIKDKRYHSAGKVQYPPSPHDLRHKAVNQRDHSNRGSAAMISDRESKVLIKRKEQDMEEFNQRELAYSQEKEKQKRSKFHRMVRDAINIYRVQSLRQKQ